MFHISVIRYPLSVICYPVTVIRYSITYFIPQTTLSPSFQLAVLIPLNITVLARYHPARLLLRLPVLAYQHKLTERDWLCAQCAAAPFFHHTLIQCCRDLR